MVTVHHFLVSPRNISICCQLFYLHCVTLFGCVGNASAAKLLNYLRCVFMSHFKLQYQHRCSSLVGSAKQYDIGDWGLHPLSFVLLGLGY